MINELTVFIGLGFLVIGCVVILIMEALKDKQREKEYQKYIDKLKEKDVS